MAKATDRLSHFRPTVLRVECVRCSRQAQMKTDKARQRHGDITLGELARRVAERGGCALAVAHDCVCTARVVEPPVQTWARLQDAMDGGWSATLYCQRRYYALKRVQTCPPVPLDVASLLAVRGEKFEIGDLDRRLYCPHCGTDGAKIEWTLPDDPPDPGGTAAREPPLQFKPTKAVLGRKRFRVVNG